MATNYVQDGCTLTLTAPYARNAGEGALIGSQFAVALSGVLISASAEWAVEGVWDLTALSTATGAQGAKVYWDDTNKRCDTSGTVGQLIGVLTTAKTNGQTTARVKLNEAVPDELRGTMAAIPDLGGALTGTTTGTMADTSAIALSTANTYTDAAVNTAVNTAITHINLEFKELQSKYNTLLAELRTAGIIAP